MKSISKIIFLVMILIIIMPLSVMGKEQISITKIDLSLMPEYDTQDVLVIYSVNFKNSTNQPFEGEIRFPVPKNTSNNIVKETSTNDDAHLEVRVEEKEGYAELIWKPSKAIQPQAAYPIHLEYYYNNLPATGNKSFAFKVPIITTIDKAEVYVYQPLKAKNFTVKPEGKALGQDKQGFNVYGWDYTNLKETDKFDFTVSYDKDDPKPSVDKPSQGVAESSAKSKFSNTTVILLTALFALVVIMALKLFSSNNGTGQSQKTKRVQTRLKEPRRSNQYQNGPITTNQYQRERKRLRQMLLDGKISEQTYLELIEELDNEN